jgi:amino acid transporter/nucleotide-binding universal stress UspA family protein
MPISVTKRPRNVSAFQAAALLYGDWGTSKAYVIGLAFALAGYSSFWSIAAISLLIALVGINYIVICKFSPSGGGVYASARRKSEVLALIGALFLIADYLITAAISSLSCFEYLGLQYPSLWAMGAIACIGGLNFFGPKHSGNVAIFVALITVVAVVMLGVISLPYIPDAIHNLEMPKLGFWPNWHHFVGIVVALSGVESIANTTGVMTLDEGSTEANPSIHQTSKKAITWVMIEVCVFTALFGFVVNAIPGLQIVNGNIDAPNELNIRDQMLRYMGNYFVTHQWGTEAMGYAFGLFIGGTFAVLLLSAVNTALVALVSLVFVMSRDGEMPEMFSKLNRFGVPSLPLLIATLTPIIILFFVNDIAHLADLYAVGFVGAIATNLGVNASDQKIPMTKVERYMMWGTFALMVAIELTLIIDKPTARRFALTVMSIGLILRALVIEHRQRQWADKKVTLRHASLYTDDTRAPLHSGAMMVAIRTNGKTLHYALEEAKKFDQPLYILYVREQKFITEEDKSKTWLDDEEASSIFAYAKQNAGEMAIKFFYSISDSPVDTIVQMAEKLKVSRLFLGRPRHSAMLQMLRGNIAQEVSETLPKDIDLVIIS